MLAPLPEAYSSQFGTLQIQNDFPSVVQSDFTIAPTATTTGIYALPLSIDTLAMIYNKDMFDSAGIATPPATWDDFEADISKLADGKFRRADHAGCSGFGRIGNQHCGSAGYFITPYAPEWDPNGEW